MNARVITVTPRRIRWTEDYFGIFFLKCKISISPVRRNGISSICRGSWGISFQYYRDTYYETSPPECGEGGDREPSDGRDPDVSPIRHR